MDLGLADKVVAVTGAAGGIGSALARTFAAEGCRLGLFVNSSRERGEAMIAENDWADRALVIEADVRDEAAMQAGFGALVDRFGRVDSCIVNAGIWPSDDTPLADMTLARFRETIEVNLIGAFVTLQAFIQRIQPDQEANAVVIGSTAGRFGEAGHADYSASKAALYGLLRSVKNELPRVAPFARINLVEPGWTVTPMAAKGLEDDAAVERIVATMPLQQVARAEDIARPVAFLASPVARHITGEVITVAGGMEGRRLWIDDDIDVARVRERLRPDA